MTKPRTQWAAKVNPLTGKVPINEVSIPEVPRMRKGRTKYDDEFEKLLSYSTALEVHQPNFELVRRALKRFLDFRDLGGAVAIRQLLNPETRMVALWLEKK